MRKPRPRRLFTTYPTERPSHWVEWVLAGTVMGALATMWWVS